MLKFPLQPLSHYMWLLICDFPLCFPVLVQSPRQDSCCVVAQRVKSILQFLEFPPSQRLPLPPNEPAEGQLHFLNSTHRLSTIKPGINPRGKMVLKSILTTPLPLLRGRLMPAQKISPQLVLSHYLRFNLFEFLRKGFHLEEKAVEIPKSVGNGSFGVIRTRGLD